MESLGCSLKHRDMQWCGLSHPFKLVKEEVRNLKTA